MEIKNSRTQIIVTCGIFIALATVLSVIQIPLPFLLYGGSVTLFSMVPIVLLSQMYGTKIGLMSGLIYGLLQSLLGATMSQAFAGVEGWSLPAMFMLDYILAFTVLGFGGIFMKKIKNKVIASTLGGILAALLRYLCHFLSGFILWGGYAEWFFSDEMGGEAGAFFLENFSGKGLAAIYSVVYNGLYMVPETVITAVGCAAAAAIPALAKLLIKPKTE